MINPAARFVPSGQTKKKLKKDFAGTAFVLPSVLVYTHEVWNRNTSPPPREPQLEGRCGARHQPTQASERFAFSQSQRAWVTDAQDSGENIVPHGRQKRIWRSCKVGLRMSYPVC